MVKKYVIITVSVVALIVAAGGGALIWWLVSGRYPYSIIELEVIGLGDVQSQAAFTRIQRAGDMFWWFYPTLNPLPTSRPIVLWLDGVTGIPPSLLANFGMFGPYDINLNRRTNSWVDSYNLLFIDAPLGTGFSTANRKNRIPRNTEESTDHLYYALQSFYDLNEEYKNSPLYIFGQGQGAQLALTLAIRFNNICDENDINLVGVAIGNAIITPAQTLTKLGFYLEEWAYIDGRGRDAIETFSNETNAFVNDGNLESAFENFLNLGEYVNENAGAIAINVGYIVEKLARENTRDTFNNKQYLQSALRVDDDIFYFMNSNVAPALGINKDTSYDEQREDVYEAFKDSFMIPATEKVEYLLQNTNISVTIYNGNLDAVSNTPGQLEWVENLQWAGQDEFMSQPRQTLIINNQIEGYFRETSRLQFYWINVAGQSAPLDNPIAMRRVLDRITSS